MRWISLIMKTVGLWTVVLGQPNRIIIGIGLVLMLGAWYLLDYYYQNEVKRLKTVEKAANKLLKAVEKIETGE
jgi:hypothetical protein